MAADLDGVLKNNSLLTTHSCNHQLFSEVGQEVIIISVKTSIKPADTSFNAADDGGPRTLDWNTFGTLRFASEFGYGNNAIILTLQNGQSTSNPGTSYTLIFASFQ